MKIVLRGGMAYFEEVNDIPVQDTAVEVVIWDDEKTLNGMFAKINNIPSVPIRGSKLIIPKVVFESDSIKVDITGTELDGTRVTFPMDPVSLRRVVVFGGSAFDVQPQSIKSIKQKIELLENELKEQVRTAKIEFQKVWDELDNVKTKGDII